MKIKNSVSTLCAAIILTCGSALAVADDAAAAATAAANPIVNGGLVQPNEEYVKTGSGLQYADIKVGSGPAARSGQRVAVHYTGWLKGRLGIPGKKFDSSRDRNEPFLFTLGQGDVIPGWDEGVQGMKVGGIRKLVVPAALGYGAKGAGDAIPPNATLIFEVELLAL
ncbi:MAG TPA: FKBP-type peptidyl-prolyl cis-trans isomerase [Spongiibacteraceae bacterium]|nr:FKBP-type peptidyl-prolyl cis-trans isomerase [Spongiibacteraceae bacterium]